MTKCFRISVFLGFLVLVVNGDSTHSNYHPRRPGGSLRGHDREGARFDDTIENNGARRRPGERKLGSASDEADRVDDENLEFYLRVLAEETASIPATTIPEVDVGSDSKQQPWPHEASDVPLDPDIVYGELENGMRYMILPNKEPQGRLQMRLRIDAGSNVEKDDEGGIAHFLEHMVFKASKNFPEGTLHPTLQDLGIDVQSHFNAYTDFPETVYWLELPNLNNETLFQSFTFMRDICDGALFLPGEIEIERGVVLSEIQDGDSVKKRIWKETWKFLLPEHRITRRFVSGTEQSILGVTREQFVDFYNEYYVPRRATFIVVGDMEAETLESMIHEHFDSFVDNGSRGEQPQYGTVPSNTGLRTAIFADEELKNDKITLEIVLPYQPVPDSVASRIEQVPLNLANAIVSRRLQMMSETEGVAIIWGSAGRSWLYNAVEFGSISVQPKQGLWRESVAILEQELRRAVLYGFTQNEVDEMASNTLNYYEQIVLSRKTRKSGGLATGLVDSINAFNVFSTPEVNLRIISLALEGATAEAIHEAFSAYWNTTDLHLYLTTKSDFDQDAASELEDLFFASQLVEVTPPEESKSIVFGYTDFGPPGTISSDFLLDDLAIRQLKLSNNIRVNIKQTAFQNGKIHIVARFGSGKLGQPKERTHLDDFTEYMVDWGGLGKHSWSDINRIVAGKTVGVGFAVHEGAFSFTGTTNPDDFEFQLQLMAAHFTDPGFRDEALRWYQDEVSSTMNFLAYDLDGAYFYGMYGWLMGDDPRFVAPTEEELLAFEISDAKEWITDQLTDSYLEISLVGDLDQDKAIDLLLKTFGAFPQRADTPEQFGSDDRAIAVPEPPQTRTFTYSSKVPVAAAVVVWKIPPVLTEDISQARRLRALGSIFNDRMWSKIREEMGSAYSPSAWTDISGYFDYSFLVAYAEGTPEEVELLSEAIMSIAENITGTTPEQVAAGQAPMGTISEDEVVRAKLPFLGDVEKTLRQNGYWLYTVMQESQAQPHHLDWSRGRKEDYESITLEDVNSLAVQYLIPQKALRIVILPESSS